VSLLPFFRVIDLEATDFAPEGKLVEIGSCDLIQRHDSILGVQLVPMPPVSTLINPGVPIPPQTSAVHHIIDEDVVFSPRLSDAIDLFVGNADVLAFVAHNASMERHYLDSHVGETPWICTWKCALRAWPDAPSHSNQALRYWLKPDGLDRGLATPAHRAGPDAYVTAFILRELLKVATADQLVEWTNDPALLVRMPFGDRKGRPWTEAEDSFLTWILERDFDGDVMFTAQFHQALRRQQRETAAADAA